MRFTINVGCAVILCLIASSAKAQFLQFTPVGGPESRPETARDRLERELQEVPFQAGPVRVAPLVGLRDLAYVRNLFASGDEIESDLTVTASAGFRAYLQTGRKVTWIAQAVPEYVWWAEREEARRLNLSYGLQTLALFNRLTIDVAASRVEQQRLLTPEVPQLVNAATDLGRFEVELEATPALYPFATLRASRQESLIDADEDPRVRVIERLDREERVARAGVRWRPSPDFTLGLGAERSQADFDDEDFDSSNEGTAPVLEVMIDRQRLFFQADLAARSLEGRKGSRFIAFDGVTGDVALSFRPYSTSRLEAWLYGNRNLVYSVSADSSYMDDRRIGTSVGWRAGQRLAFRAFAETGTNDYAAFSPATPPRKDDLTSLGGSVRFTIAGTLNLLVQAARIEIDSNVPGRDRSYSSGGLTLSLGGNLIGKNL
jgi:hypothetical protein